MTIIHTVTALSHREEIRARVTHSLAIVQLLSTLSHVLVMGCTRNGVTSLTDLSCSKPPVQVDHETRTVTVLCHEDQLALMIVSFVLCLCSI